MKGGFATDRPILTKTMKRFPQLFAFLGLVLCPALPAADQVFFAFDDESIPWKHNLHLTLVQGEKHPDNPVLRCGPEGSPDFGHAILYGTVLHDGSKFRMWYLGMIERKIERGQAPGYWRPMCYAESTDGVHWTKPDLGLVELKGNTHNNICLIESDPFSLSRVNDFLSVLDEPNEPDPQKRYKCVYIAHPPFEDIRGGRSALGQNESRWCSVVCATSADGLRWKVVGDRPSNSGAERFEGSSLYRFGNFYYITGQLISPWTWMPDGKDAGRIMLAYRSPDFEHWSQAKAFSFARPIQMTGSVDKPLEGPQTHMGAGIWNRGNVLVGFYGLWTHGPKEKPKGAPHLWGMRLDLGLVVSNDGIHFREPVADFKIIPRGQEGKDWDCFSLLQGHAFVNVGGQTYVWYSHWDNDGEFRNQEIGLATWRRDGFGYLTPHVTETGGHCITQTIPATSSPASVFINAAGVTPEAPITVELLDDRDQPLPEFTGVHAAVISAESLRGAVIWPNSKNNQLPKDRAVSLRVNFPPGGKSRLFAIYLGAN